MQNNQVQLYFKENYQELDWPETEQASYLKGYFEPLILNGIPLYISNVTATPFIIKLEDLVLPGILPGKMTDCYVCSPYSQYITYAIAELREIGSTGTRLLLKALLKGVGGLAKNCDINCAIYINNWLLSTNLYPQLSAKQIQTITSHLKKQYPQKVIIFRSLNEKTNSSLIDILECMGASKTLSRQVYVTDPLEKKYEERKDFHKDRKFLKKSKLHVQKSDFETKNLEQIKYLYDQLYIDKYFDLNPQFTMDYFQNAVDHKLFRFQLFKTDEQVGKAVLGYFYRNGVMTTPIFGFQTSAPPKEGLYRLISAALMQESEEHGLTLNQSSGAAHFKRQRGAEPYIEYNYYFAEHVPLKQRLIWKFLSSLLNSIGVYTLQKLKL